MHSKEVVITIINGIVTHVLIKIMIAITLISKTIRHHACRFCFHPARMMVLEKSQMFAPAKTAVYFHRLISIFFEVDSSSEHFSPE